MLRPWPASLTPSLAALSLVVACSSAGTELNTMSSSETGDDYESTAQQTGDPSTVPTTSGDNSGTDTATTFTTSDPSTTSGPTSATTGTASESDTSGGPSSGTTSDDTTGDDTSGTGSTGSTSDGTSTGSTGSTTGDSSSSTGEPPESCMDNLKNGDETDVDCGGSCDGCLLGEVCSVDGDCVTLSCEAELCVAASCGDGKKDGNETDIDCGGDCEDDCLDGDSCLLGDDCVSGVCEGDICQVAACDDKVKNGDETDLDCGGTCDGCAAGLACDIPADCADGVCSNDICVGPGCDDGIKNGMEAGLDCGGPSCGPCELVINEVDYDQINGDNAEYIEIFNKEPGTVDLKGIHVVLVNGADNKTYRDIDLGPAGPLAGGQYLVIGPPNFMVPNGVLKVAFPGAADQVQNGGNPGPDGIALIDATNKKLLDAFSYEGSLTMATVTGLVGPQNLVEGTVLPANVADSNTVVGSLARLPNGTDTNNAATDWAFTANITPGLANTP